MTPDRNEAERLVRRAEELYAAEQYGECEAALFRYFQWRHPYSTNSIDDIEQRAVTLDNKVANHEYEGYRS